MYIENQGKQIKNCTIRKQSFLKLCYEGVPFFTL